MPTINMLASVDTVTGGDQFPIYAPNNGDARKASMTTIMTYVRNDLGSGSIASLSVTGEAQVGYLSRGAPVTKTANFALANNENWVICNGSLANVTATLPAASDWTGREIMFKNLSGTYTVVSSSANVLPLIGGSAGTDILGATAGAWVTLVSNGTHWVAMQGS